MGKTMQMGHNFAKGGRVAHTIKYARGGKASQFTAPGPAAGTPRAPRARALAAPAAPAAPGPAALAALAGARGPGPMPPVRRGRGPPPVFNRGGAVKSNPGEFENTSSPVKHGTTFGKGGRAQR